MVSHPIAILNTVSENLARQTVWMFDLTLGVSERSQRHAKLDRVLAQFFNQLKKNPPANMADFWQNIGQFSHIIHAPAKPAKAVFLDKLGEKIAYTLAISYALPYVAVALTPLKHFGLDICAVQAFDSMDLAERQQFCHDYFAPVLGSTVPISMTTFSTNRNDMAKCWSAYEATLKCLALGLDRGLDMRQLNAPFYQQLENITVSSEKVTLDNGEFWLSMAIKD